MKIQRDGLALGRLAPAALAMMVCACPSACNLLSGLGDLEFVVEPSGTGGTGGTGGAGGTGAGGTACVNAAVDCEKPDTECKIAVCEMGACAIDFADAMPLPDMTAGDCKARVCDGNGLEVEVDEPGDAQDDSNDCTSDSCEADGTTAHEPLMAGVSCRAPSAKVCNDQGACVECIDDTHCTSPATCGGGGTAEVCGCSHLCTTSWAGRFGDGSDQDVRGVTVDSEGGLLVTGANNGILQLGMQTLTQGANDFYIARLDNNGEPLWSKALGGPGFETGEGIAVDGMNNVLVAGAFDTTLDLPGTMLTSTGGSDIFAAKLDKDGNALWGTSFGGGMTSEQHAHGVAADGIGNVLLTGTFKGDLTIGGASFTNPQGADIFVAKLDGAGLPVWSRQFGDTGDQAGLKIAADSNGNVIVVGHFENELMLDFGGGPLPSHGAKDIFVAKLDGAGLPVWSQSFGDFGEDLVRGLLVDPAGGVIITGSFSGAVDFGGGALMADGQDGFVVKLDADGSHVWSRSFGGAGVQDAQSVALDGQGGLLVSGFFENEITFDGEPKLKSGGLGDVFLMKLDETTGDYVNGRPFGDSTSQGGTSCVAADSAGNVFLASSFEGNADLGTGVLINAGGSDIFLAKFPP